MVIGILALQGDFEAHARMLARLGLRPLREQDRVAGASPPASRGDSWLFVRQPTELRQAEALILPGGESTTMLKLLRDGGWWQELREFVRRRPCFGTCAGLILLAREVTAPAQPSLAALDVVVERNAYGRQIDSSIRHGRLVTAAENAATKTAAPPGSAGGELEMVFIRAPKIAALGPGVEVLAHQAGLPVLVRQGSVMAATFHPELADDPRLHRQFLELVRQVGGASPC